MTGTLTSKLPGQARVAGWLHSARRSNRVRKISLAWQYQALRRWLTGRPALNEARLIHRDADLAIAWLPGRSTRLVLVFVSIQARPFHPDKLQLRGFVSNHGQHHVIFINDRRNCWYSRDGMRDRIACTVNQVIAREGIETIWSIGNSMGGYGAILFCDRLPITRVLAFVPQILMTDEVINQPIWRKNRPVITDQVERDLTGLMADTTRTFHLVYGDKDDDDPIHFSHLRRRLPAAPHVKIVVAPGQQHHVANWLRSQGQLGKLIDAIWAEDREALEACSRKLTTPFDLSLA
jgi:hypothetical protein